MIDLVSIKEVYPDSVAAKVGIPIFFTRNNEFYVLRQYNLLEDTEVMRIGRNYFEGGNGYDDFVTYVIGLEDENTLIERGILALTRKKES